MPLLATCGGQEMSTRCGCFRETLYIQCRRFRLWTNCQSVFWKGFQNFLKSKKPFKLQQHLYFNVKYIFAEYKRVAGRHDFFQHGQLRNDNLKLLENGFCLQ